MERIAKGQAARAGFAHRTSALIDLPAGHADKQIELTRAERPLPEERIRSIKPDTARRSIAGLMDTILHHSRTTLKRLRVDEAEPQDRARADALLLKVARLL